jgi:hypothetical protein
MSANPVTLATQAGVFCLLLILLGVVSMARSIQSRKRRIIALAGYVFFIHLAIGITQKDAWPITNYRLLHGIAAPAAEMWRYRFNGVDSNGHEWPIDPYAWRGAISDWHLQFSVYGTFEKLPYTRQQEALAWLYKLAELERARLAKGDQSVSPLGSLSAPAWYLFPRELSVPQEPYRGLRLYKETFLVRDAMTAARRGERAGDYKFPRKLLGEWRAP